MRFIQPALALLATAASVDAFWLHRHPHASALDYLRGDAWDFNRGRRTESDDVSDIYRALQELTTDLTSQASRAKHSLLTPGLYLRSDDNIYVLSMDTPGITRKELVVKVDRGILSIHGRHECPILASTNATDPFCIERAFDASFTLPSDADADKASAGLDAGVVRVIVPKVAKDERATGRILNLAEETVNEWYNQAKDSAYNAYDTAAASADSAKGSAQKVYERAYDAAAAAADQAAGAAAAATDKVRSVASTASASAASVASEISATVNSVVASATHEASKTVSSVSSVGSKSAKAASKSLSSASSVASASASSAASVASTSAASAASAASASAASVTSSLKGHATEEPHHDKKGIYERVKEAVVGAGGGTSGEIPVEKGEL